LPSFKGSFFYFKNLILLMLEFKLSQLGEQLVVKVRQSLKAKHRSIRIHHHGQVELVIPFNDNFLNAQDILNAKERWIRSKLNKIKPKELINKSICVGDVIPILGVPHTIFHHVDANNRTIQVVSGSIYISQSDIYLYGLRRFLLQLLREKIEVYLAKFSLSLKVSYRRYSIKDTKSRWGSCTSKGDLNFSWRLIFAPEKVVTYLVAHEICHIKEMNHSKKFWQLVANIYPEYKQAKMWLKNNGRTLHNYSFSVKPQR
jgi:hypothetical protein